MSDKQDRLLEKAELMDYFIQSHVTPAMYYNPDYITEGDASKISKPNAIIPINNLENDLRTVMWSGLAIPSREITPKSTNCKNCAAPTSHNRDDCAYCGTIYG